MGGFEFGWLSGFGPWTDAIHGVVTVGFVAIGAVCAVTLALQVYRYALTGLAWMLGKRG